MLLCCCEDLEEPPLPPPTFVTQCPPIAIRMFTSSIYVETAVLALGCTSDFRCPDLRRRCFANTKGIRFTSGGPPWTAQTGAFFMPGVDCPDLAAGFGPGALSPGVNPNISIAKSDNFVVIGGSGGLSRAAASRSGAVGFGFADTPAAQQRITVKFRQLAPSTAPTFPHFCTPPVFPVGGGLSSIGPPAPAHCGPGNLIAIFPESVFFASEIIRSTSEGYLRYIFDPDDLAATEAFLNGSGPNRGTGARVEIQSTFSDPLCLKCPGPSALAGVRSRVGSGQGMISLAIQCIQPWSSPDAFPPGFTFNIAASGGPCNLFSGSLNFANATSGSGAWTDSVLFNSVARLGEGTPTTRTNAEGRFTATLAGGGRQGSFRTSCSSIGPFDCFCPGRGPGRKAASAGGIFLFPSSGVQNGSQVTCDNSEPSISGSVSC